MTNVDQATTTKSRSEARVDKTITDLAHQVGSEVGIILTTVDQTSTSTSTKSRREARVDKTITDLTH